MISLAVNYFKNYLITNLSCYLNKTLNKPIQILINVTKRCNARCLMCDLWLKNKPTKDEELSIKEWSDFLLDLKLWLGSYFVTFNGGEPFLKEDFLELLRFCKDNQIKTHVITNGIVFNRNYCDLILEAGLNSITFSLDSRSPQIHDKFRNVVGTHEKIIEAIKYLKKTKIFITILCIIMKDNYKDLTNFTNWVLAMGVDRLDFQPIENNLVSEERTNYAALRTNPFWQLDNLGMLEREFKNLLGLKKNGYSIKKRKDYFKKMQLYFQDPELVRHKGRCRTAFDHLVVNYNGDVKLCIFPPKIGNIRKDSISQIWHSQLADIQRKNMQNCNLVCMNSCRISNTLWENIKFFYSLLKKDYI